MRDAPDNRKEKGDFGQARSGVEGVFSTEMATDASLEVLRGVLGSPVK